MEERRADQLLRKNFMSKVLIDEFDKLLDENDFKFNAIDYKPISYESFEGLSRQFTVKLQRNTKLIPIEAKPDQIDEDYVKGIVDSLLWATKMYVYCTHFAHDKSIMSIPSLKGIKGPFYNAGYTTLLDLALIYANTNNPDNLKGIGEDKYKKFRKFFSTDCKEFEIYKENKSE